MGRVGRGKGVRMGITTEEIKNEVVRQEEKENVKGEGVKLAWVRGLALGARGLWGLLGFCYLPCIHL